MRSASTFCQRSKIFLEYSAVFTNMSTACVKSAVRPVLKSHELHISKAAFAKQCNQTACKETSATRWAETSQYNVTGEFLQRWHTYNQACCQSLLFPSCLRSNSTQPFAKRCSNAAGSIRGLVQRRCERQRRATSR